MEAALPQLINSSPLSQELIAMGRPTGKYEMKTEKPFLGSHQQSMCICQPKRIKNLGGENGVGGGYLKIALNF